MRFRYSAEENGKPVKKAAVYTQDEHRINLSDVDSQAIYIIERLQANGYESYIVGGAVRDLILGRRPKDFDIVTAAAPGKIKKLFRNSRIIGRRFRLVHVFFGSKIFEVSTFRSNRDGPTSNTFGTIEEDVLRRDFSLNALFYDPVKQLVVDYVGGMKDIKRRVIRPIIALEDIFTDDPVRMIRAVKYAAVSGFRLPFSLRLRIRKHRDLLARISPSRLTEEIFKIIHSPRALEIVGALNAMKIYSYLQPGASELFKSVHGFKAQYFKTMGRLGADFKNLPGEALSALIRDYFEGVLKKNQDDVQDKSAAERYKVIFNQVRQFVLPMNPPRIELYSALRLLFAEKGIVIKKPHFSERNKKHHAETETPGVEENSLEPQKKPANRKRRPRCRRYPQTQPVQ